MKIKFWGETKKLYKNLGPGVITGASDDDPSGILTYLQTGTILGLRSLWLALLTLPMMYSIQEMCGRIGYVTNKGLMSVIKEHYPKYVLYFIASISVVVITINIGADLSAAGAIFEKFSGVGRGYWIPFLSMFITLAIIFFSYQKFAKILKWLTLTLFFYVILVFFIEIDWIIVIKNTFIPSISFSKESILLITAVFGTTISPYLFFWQASEEMEEREETRTRKLLKRLIITKKELKALKQDTFVGMLFSNAVMWFIIVGASQLGTLYGVKEIANFDQAAMVLQPLLGDKAFLAFGLGIIGTGLLAIPVLAGSVGYILSEMFNWGEGLSKKFHEAKGFYIVIGVSTLIGMAINFLRVDPITMLIYAAVFYTIITPPLIYLIMRIANNRKIMKRRVNTGISNALGSLTFVAATAAVIAYIYSVI